MGQQGQQFVQTTGQQQGQQSLIATAVGSKGQVGGTTMTTQGMPLTIPIQGQRILTTTNPQGQQIIARTATRADLEQLLKGQQGRMIQVNRGQTGQKSITLPGQANLIQLQQPLAQGSQGQMSFQGAPGTLVKTVSAPTTMSSQTVTIPMSAVQQMVGMNILPNMSKVTISTAGGTHTTNLVQLKQQPQSMKGQIVTTAGQQGQGQKTTAINLPSNMGATHILQLASGPGGQPQTIQVSQGQNILPQTTQGQIVGTTVAGQTFSIPVSMSMAGMNILSSPLTKVTASGMAGVQANMGQLKQMVVARQAKNQQPGHVPLTTQLITTQVPVGGQVQAASGQPVVASQPQPAVVQIVTSASSVAPTPPQQVLPKPSTDGPGS
jgi:hypothetical protein